MTNSNETVALGTSSQGVELRGNVLRLLRHSAAFELYDPRLVLRLSEVLTDFRILASERTLYLGRAVVSNVMNMGTMIVCEVTLDETGWLDVDLKCVRNGGGGMAKEYADFIRRWQKNYKIAEPYLPSTPFSRNLRARLKVLNWIWSPFIAVICGGISTPWFFARLFRIGRITNPWGMPATMRW